jgi:SOS response regulatory protein OraA/RecX
MNVTTNFGEVEDMIQRKIDANRGRARVAADLSSKGVDQIKADEAAEKAMAEDLLTKYEVQLGLKSPETTPIAETVKNLGPTVEKSST